MATTARSNVEACGENKEEKLTPYIAAGCERHNLPLGTTLGRSTAFGGGGADAVETMKHRLRTPEGRAIYGHRKCTVEPVFGIIKAVLGFR